MTDLRALIRDVPDFPTPGVVFKDITPLLAHPGVFGDAIEAMSAPYAGNGVTTVAAIEARGFIFGVPIARALGVGFVPVRKEGKLPYEVAVEEYSLEYGSDRLEMHRDSVGPGDRVLVVDDVLATGGTAAAAIRLIERLGASVAGVSVLAELGFLKGADRIPAGVMLTKLVRYDVP